VQPTGHTPDLEPALLTAERLLEWRRRSGPNSDAPFPPNVIVTHQPSVFRALVPRFKSRALPGLSTPLRTIERGRIAVALPAIGASATAMLVDELAVRGVRLVSAVDLCASISPDVPSGVVVLVESACCGDGTSPHYAPGRQFVEANKALVELLASTLEFAGVPFLRGRVWSTDAPYRETPSLLQRAREAGALGIDMETSAFYAAGSASDSVACVSVLVTADRLLDAWQPPSDMSAVNAMLRRIAGVVLSSQRS